MERSKRARSSFDHVGRSSTPTSSHNSHNAGSGALNSAFSSRNHSMVDSSTSSVVKGTNATRRRHVHQMSLPQYLGFTVDVSRQLSPFEEKFLGRVPRPPGIPLAEPNSPPPTVVGKLFSGVKRAVTLKREKTPPEDEPMSTTQPVPRFGHSSTFPLPRQQFSTSSVNLVKRPRTAPQSIITAHRSPFGGYTKSGDFVVTRTTDGKRLPVPQPHPHSYTNPHVNLPPPPSHSALKKSSNVSFESDSFTLVTTPDSASSTGSTNGTGSFGRTGKNITMLAKLMGKSQKKSASSSSSSSEVVVTQISTRKAVRFSVEAEET